MGWLTIVQVQWAAVSIWYFSLNEQNLLETHFSLGGFVDLHRDKFFLLMHRTDFSCSLWHFNETVYPELCRSEKSIQLEVCTCTGLNSYVCGRNRLIRCSWKIAVNECTKALDHMYSCAPWVLCGLALFSAIPHFLPKCLSWLQWKKQWWGAGDVLLETLTSSKTLRPRTRSRSKNVFEAVHASDCNQALDSGLCVETLKSYQTG